MGISLKQFGNRLVDLLPELMQEISRYENNYVTNGKITCHQFLVLEKMADGNPWKMNELVQTMRSSFSSMTETMDRLVKHGLVKRERGLEDRRTVLVSITPKGKRVVDQVYTQKKEGIIHLFKRLSDQEREDYLRILEKLVQSLSSMQGAAA